MVRIEANTGQVMRALVDYSDKHARFALALALTRTAQHAQTSLRQQMSERFDRPTPYAVRSAFVRPATKAKLEASVGIADRTLSKAPLSPVESIGHEFTGGQRALKRIERYLARAGLIRMGEFVAPGAGARLDSYGNMSRGQVQQIIAQLKIGIDAYSHSSKSERSRRSTQRAGELFWSRGGRLRRGVWMRSGRNVKPILLVIATPRYRQRIDIERTVEQAARLHLNDEFRAAMARARATAR